MSLADEPVERRDLMPDGTWKSWGKHHRWSGAVSRSTLTLADERYLAGDFYNSDLFSSQLSLEKAGEIIQAYADKMRLS